MINNIYDIINRSGVQMLIFLAGLQSISPAIYESCDIDGATQWETFWRDYGTDDFSDDSCKCSIYGY